LRGESSSCDEARESTSLPYSPFVRRFSTFFHDHRDSGVTAKYDTQTLRVNDRGRNPHPKIREHSNCIGFHLRAGKRKDENSFSAKVRFLAGLVKRDRIWQLVATQSISFKPVPASQRTNPGTPKLPIRYSSFGTGVFRDSRFSRTTMYLKVLAFLICFSRQWSSVKFIQ